MFNLRPARIKCIQCNMAIKPTIDNMCDECELNLFNIKVKDAIEYIRLKIDNIKFSHSEWIDLPYARFYYRIKKIEQQVHIELANIKSHRKNHGKIIFQGLYNFCKLNKFEFKVENVFNVKIEKYCRENNMYKKENSYHLNYQK